MKNKKVNSRIRQLIATSLRSIEIKPEKTFANLKY